MKKTYFACIFLLFASGSFGQRQDNIESQEPAIEYETNTNPAFSNSYAVSKAGSFVEQLNDKPLYATSVHHGKLHGEWQSWYQNGSLCDSGTLVKGLPDGVWKHWDAEGNLIALRSYSADKYHRIKNEMVRYHPKRVSFPLAVLYQQSRQAALRYLHVSYSFAAAHGNTDQSLPELIKKNITPGNAYIPVFDHALHHGLYVNFFADGKVKDSGSYGNGLRQGLWVHRDTSKKVMLKGSYTNGIKIKEWKVLDELGKLQEIMFYNSKGQLKWRKRFQRPVRRTA